MLKTLLITALLFMSAMPYICCEETKQNNPLEDSESFGRATKDVGVVAIADDWKTYPVGKKEMNATIKNYGSQTETFNVSYDFSYANLQKEFYDDVESGIGEWKHTNLTNTSKWHYITGIPNDTVYDGTKAIWCGIDDKKEYGNYWEEIFVSKKININSSEAENITLTFMHNYTIEEMADGGYVQVYNPAMKAWATVKPIDGYPKITGADNLISYTDPSHPTNPKTTEVFASNIPTGWNKTIFHLGSDYNGSEGDIQIKFWFTSGALKKMRGWFIDNVTINDSTKVHFFDDFEDVESNNWTAYDLIEAKDEWRQNYDKANSHSPNKAWVASDFDTKKYAKGADSVLTSGKINLSSATNSRLIFWHNYSIAVEDGGFVEVSTDDLNWTYIKPITSTGYTSTISESSPYGAIDAFGGISNGWKEVVFDISAYVNNEIRIRFHFYSNYDDQVDAGWFIDDITVMKWNFAYVDSIELEINLDSGQTKYLFYNYSFGKEGDWRITATTKLIDDEVTGNNATFIIIHIKNIYDFTMQIDPSALDILHGRTGYFNLTINNTGNTNTRINLTGNAPQNWALNFQSSFIFLDVNKGAVVNVSVKTSIDTPLREEKLVIEGETIGIRKNISFYVNVLDTPPKANAGGNKTGRVYIPIQFDAGNSFDQDNDEMFYYWEFGDGENATGIKISHTYKKSGVYNLTLIVSDGNLNGIDNATITIENKEPKPKINILTPAENGTHPIKDDIIFDGSESTDEYTIGLNYTWKFGDGGEAKGSRVNHSYKKGGEYSVVLYAIDTEGLMNYTSRNIRVNNPPVCKIVSPKNNAKYTTRDLIHFIGEGNDEDGDVLRYEWLIDDQLFHVEQSFNDTIIADGWHTVKLVVYDGYALPKDYWDNTEMIIINIIPHPNIKPDLFNGSVTPSSGIEDTLFNFTVKYIDEDDDKPSYMHVVIDGISFDMFEVDTNDTTYKDGKLYYYTMKLSGASYHTYHFKTIDKRGETNVTQPQKGPKVLRVSTIIHENIYIVATYAGPGTISVSKIGKPKDISNPKDTLDIGLFYNITSKGIELEDIDIIEIRISYKDLNVSKVNVSTLKIYHLTDAGWELVPLTGVDTSGSVVWAKVRSLTIFGVFGSKAPGVPTNGKDHGPPIEKGYLVWIAGAVIVIVIFLSVFVLAWKREAKKKEERIEIRIEGEVAEEVVKEKKILPTEAVSVTIEEAKVFKPIEEKEKKAIEEKKILPTEAVSVTIEEAKIFRPGKAIEEKEEVEEKKEVDLLKEMEEILELTKKKEEKKVEKKKDEDIFDDILKDIEEMKKK